MRVDTGDAVRELVSGGLPHEDRTGGKGEPTARASAAGTCSSNMGDPYVVRTPAVSNRSLTAIGMPSSGRATPAAQARSATRACTLARSNVVVTNASSSDSCPSIRSVNVSTSSTGETRRVPRMPRAAREHLGRRALALLPLPSVRDRDGVRAHVVDVAGRKNLVCPEACAPARHSRHGLREAGTCRIGAVRVGSAPRGNNPGAS